MIERSDNSEPADDALPLRLFHEPSSETRDAAGSCDDALLFDRIAVEDGGSSEGELPPDLLALADRLTMESHSLAMTYPARAPERLPLGEAVLASASSPEAISPGAEEVVQVCDRTAGDKRRIVGAGMVATAGLAALVAAAFYFEAARPPGGLPSAIVLPLDDAASTDLRPRETPAAPEREGVQVRTVSLSLADDGDYRRLESLLRNRSEPEREAMFDLLQNDDGDETAVRISF